jgi:SlyX protein
MSLDDRLTDLEVRLAHQDHTIHILDEVLRTFTVRVERLERQLAELRKGAGDLGPVGPADDPPPHY